MSNSLTNRLSLLPLTEEVQVKILAWTFLCRAGGSGTSDAERVILSWFLWTKTQ